VGLLGVVAGAWIVRTVAADAFATPTHHAALSMVLALEELADERSAAELFAYWRSLLTSFQGLSLVERSAFALPGYLALYRIIGPVLSFATLAGAVWGIVAVVLAWSVGRRLAGEAVGLLFAAFLAASPVQIVWSRIGGLYITAVPQVLAAVWLAMACVERRSIALALLSGACCWSTLYGYYAARIAMPVCVWVIATWGERLSWRRRLVLVLAWLAPGLAAYVVWGNGLLETLWPLVGFRFFPDVTNAEASSVLGASLEAIGDSTRHTLRLMLVAGRLPAWETSWSGGQGGAIPVAVAVLGGVGLLRALVDVRRFHVWLVLVGCALLPSIMSTAELRRLLVFDMSWQLLAALGVVSLGSMARRFVAPRWQAGLATVGLVALAWWSTTLVVRLTAASPREISAIPFGSGMGGENDMCRGCVWRARRWRDAVAGGHAVVVFDNDAVRHDRQFHLRAYGYVGLAAHGGGHPHGAWDFYQAVRGVRDRWTFPSDRLWTDDWRAFLRRELSAPWIEGVLWYFANPTPLEREAVARLERAGGRVTAAHFPFDARATLGAPWQERLGGETIEVVTPPDAVDDALTAIEESLWPAPARPAVRAGTLHRVASRPLPAPAFDVAGMPRADGRTAWAAMMPMAVDVDGTTRPTGRLLTIASRADGDFLPITVAGRIFSWRKAGPADGVAPVLLPIGYRCAAPTAEHWFVVDAASGRLRSDTGVGWLPDRAWVGVATVGERLVLASAAHELVIADVDRRQVFDSWTVPVWPGPRRMYGECSSVLATESWVGTYDWASGTAAVVNVDGGARATLDVRRTVGADVRIDGLGAAGDELGVAITTSTGPRLDTFRVVLDASQ
jgi:hypothetical protein